MITAETITQKNNAQTQLIGTEASIASDNQVLLNNKTEPKKAQSNLARASEHLGKVLNADPNDPNRKKWQREIRTFLKNAQKAADRLPGRLREVIEQRIKSIGGQL